MNDEHKEWWFSLDDETKEVILEELNTNVKSEWQLTENQYGGFDVDSNYPKFDILDGDVNELKWYDLNELTYRSETFRGLDRFWNWFINNYKRHGIKFELYE